MDGTVTATDDATASNDASGNDTAVANDVAGRSESWYDSAVDHAAWYGSSAND